MLSVQEVASSTRAGESTPKDHLESAQKRQDAAASLNAFVPTENATRLGKTTGLLAGVPVSIKDNLLLEGSLCSCGSAALRDYRAPYTAHAVERLLDEGATLIGRTNMDEFAMGSTTETSIYGPTLNPWDPERVPGGSSGGAAASVAAGITSIAIGSSTGGSVRQPAAYCGVVGLKPSYGRISRRGLVAYASSLDVIAPIGARVADCEQAYLAMLGDDFLDETQNTSLSTNRPPQKTLSDLRIGLLVEGLSPRNHPDINRHVERAAEILRDTGAEVKACHLPDLEQALAAYYVIAPAEASSNLSRFDGIRYGPSLNSKTLSGLYSTTRSSGFGAEVKRRILMGTFCLSAGYADAYYGRALGRQAALRAQLQALFVNFDALLLPTTPDVAPRLGEAEDPLKMMQADIYTVIANLAGIPAISVPTGLSRDLPVGVQFMANHGQEALLLSIAQEIEDKAGRLICPV